MGRVAHSDKTPKQNTLIAFRCQQDCSSLTSNQTVNAVASFTSARSSVLHLVIARLRGPCSFTLLKFPRCRSWISTPRMYLLSLHRERCRHDNSRGSCAERFHCAEKMIPRIPRHFTPEQHGMLRLHPLRAERQVVLPLRATRLFKVLAKHSGNAV